MANNKKLCGVLSGISLVLTVFLLSVIFLRNSDPGQVDTTKAVKLDMMGHFDMQMNNAVSNALDGVLSIKKQYWLDDDTMVAPEPNQANYGTTDDASTLQWLLDAAADLLDGQETYFTTETQILPGTEITYYLDETILAITWKENINNMNFTVSEVKIADASQFRRFLAGGEYGSSVQLATSEMATSVNAVVASSADFYKFRRAGVIVYDETLMRFEGQQLDTCFVDDNGDLLFAYRGDLSTEEEAKRFVEENNIRFSFAFGPILIDNGERREPAFYPVGEIYEEFSRAGIGQKGELHYILTTVNHEYLIKVPNIYSFAASVEQFGCEKFYTLDGGQTATIVMNDRVINSVDYGNERKISDILYFATALPSGN